MRAFDRTMPEEVNRVITDRISGLCLCSTTVALENLEREGLGAAAVLVGDVMADIALHFSEVAERRSTIIEDHALQSGGFALVTAHRAGNVDDPARLDLLIDLLSALPLAVFYPVHPRTHRRLSETGQLARLAAAPNVTLSPPIGYLDVLKLAAHAGVVITDSGGLQKEAYVLGTKCITLRDRTEWVETVDAGWNTLVDLSKDAALEALGHEPPPAHPDLYRAGRAAAGIVEAIGAWTPELGG
jgi:UDP-N-acetylglucosamine 2-epimerase (non-hydrolysing)/UDP-GlcNAc3NAcA epimerase